MAATSTPKRRRRKARRRAAEWVAYLRVSTKEQGESGAGLGAQRRQIEAAARVKGIVIARWYLDVFSAETTDDREQLALALDDCRQDRAAGVIVANLGRLARNTAEYIALGQEALKGGWQVICLDVDFDVTSPTGEFMSTVVAASQQWERRIIGQRTKDGMATKRDEGVRLGAPRIASDELLAQVLATYAEQGSYAGAARALTAAGVATPTGKATWYPASVSGMVNSQDGRAMASSL